MFFYRFRLFIKRYTNFQKRLYLFTNLYGSLLRKILEILKYFQYTKIYETMKNVCIEGVRSTLWKYFVWWWVCDNSTILSKFCIYFIYKSLTPIFYFLCKAKVCIYYSFYLPFLLSKKTLSCSLCLIKLLILCMLRLKILFLRFLFSLVVSYSIT